MAQESQKDGTDTKAWKMMMVRSTLLHALNDRLFILITQKMGYVPGMGLGKNLQGDANAPGKNVSSIHCMLDV